MCIFSRPVHHVSSTRIFARSLGDQHQALAYSMNVGLEEDAAMVLPLPVPPNPREDAVRFVDLQKHRDFFEKLEAAFPQPETMPMSRGRGLGPGLAQPMLKVHDVGDFEASFVPTIGDFGRLDPRFRLPDDVWSGLPQYADWGFAVFKLKAKQSRFLKRLEKQTIQPMAFIFPRRDPDALFFPTMHVHDGHLPENAEFDHAFFAQVDEVTARVTGCEQSSPLRETMPNDLADLVSLEDRAVRWRRGGIFPNEDTWLRTAEVDGALDCRGTLHRLAIQLRYLFWPPTDALSRCWTENVAQYAAALPRHLHDELAILFERNANAWRLVELDEKLPKGFVSNGHVFLHMLDGRSGPQPVPPDRPFRVDFLVGTDRVERQVIELAFSDAPSPKRYAEIEGALKQLIDRVAFS